MLIEEMFTFEIGIFQFCENNQKCFNVSDNDNNYTSIATNLLPKQQVFYRKFSFSFPVVQLLVVSQSPRVNFYHQSPRVTSGCEPVSPKGPTIEMIIPTQDLSSPKTLHG